MKSNEPHTHILKEQHSVQERFEGDEKENQKLIFFMCLGGDAVSYTHLTLPTKA